MNVQYLALVSLASPLALVLTAIVSWFQKGIHPLLMKRLSMISAVVSMLTAFICACFVIKYGLLETDLLGIYEVGFSLRLDALSMLMFSMIALIAFVVVKFSINYLDGDERQGIFMGRLAATIASVQLLVLSGNLGLLFISWVLTSVSLHRLLVFYAERPGAIIAARKKFIVARLGDTCLFMAIALLYFQFNTGNLEAIFQSIKSYIQSGSVIISIELAAILLVLAALLKSAQVPTHGWLIEVMETPTPVSALLHAGLLNAGPFLIVRMAYLVETSLYASLTLILVGGLTALFASVVFLTQTSVKTALGYSSIAHMGFSLMVCGLGLYPAAMLHLVAHSFYKAHAFLSSGSVIDKIRISGISSVTRKYNPLTILSGILIAISLYVCFAILWSVNLESQIPVLVIGSVIAMGMSMLFVSALDSKANIKLIIRTSLLAILVITAFFSLESATHILLNGVLPHLRIVSTGEVVLMCCIVFIFGTTVFVQLLSPAYASASYMRIAAIHLRNGFYMNALFDRLVGSLKIHAYTNNTRQKKK